MPRERKYLKNPCVVCGQEQIGLHHHENTKVPKSHQRCFQMHVSHHIRDLGYSEKQGVAIAYAEERAGKLKGVCTKRKLRKLS